jgi:hypothetical protein
VRRVLLVLTVALVMAVMMVSMAMPAFAQAADPCTTEDTPSSPPEASPTSEPPPIVAPGYARRTDKERPGTSATPFTGPTFRGSCSR